MPRLPSYTRAGGGPSGPPTVAARRHAGDHLANGDSGGDAVFGGRGDDVLWGGAGRVCAYTDTVCVADRGPADEFVDHLLGGKGEDVIDWRPRGAYGTGPSLSGRTCAAGTVPTGARPATIRRDADVSHWRMTSLSPSVTP